MAAQAGAWIIRSETEWFGSSSIDHLEDIDAHTVRDDFHLVDQTDIHRPMNIFQQLGHFRRLGGTDRHDLIDGMLVECNTDLETGRRMTTNHFRDGTGFEIGVTRVFAFRGIDQEDVFTDTQATFFDARQQFFFSSARVGSAF
ncbi:hypothetical protein D9M69_585820 [compost metagenome]